MSIEDLEFVERMTGVSLDEDKPLSNIKRRSTQHGKSDSSRPRAGASVEQPKKSDYDWFDFFLQCGVNPQICERYAQSFSKDQMGEENLIDIEPPLLRTLGLKEGDILRVMKFLDTKYSRTGAREKRNVSFGGASVIGDGEGDGEGTNGGLFSGPGGTLRNNTRKGRPAPTVQTNDVVDPKVFEQKTEGAVKRPSLADSTATPLASAPERQPTTGFDDSAWEVKPSKQEPAAAAPVAPAAPSSAATPTPTQTTTAPPAPLSGSLAELSLLSPPLQPTPVPQPTSQQQPPQAPVQAPAPQPQQEPQQNNAPQGADPSFFNRLGQTPSGQVQHLPPPQQQLPQGFAAQPTGYGSQPLQQQQTGPARQRPQPPQQTQSQGGLIAPPPPRASSAPQNFQQQSAFGPPPLQPQLTGYQQQPSNFQPQALQGQSLQELGQQRLQAQQQQQFNPQQPLQGQPTGFNPLLAQSTGYNQFSSPSPQQQLPPQPTGFSQPSFQQQPFLNGGQPNPSPFADPARPSFQHQPTGFQPGQGGGAGINSILPPPLQPQPTGVNGFQAQSFAGQQLQAQNTGFGGGGGPQGPNGFGGPPPPVPPMPSQPTGLQPLQPQKTGPPPPVRFGVTGGANKLMPQPTGRRANLSQASKCSPSFRTLVPWDIDGELCGVSANGLVF